MSFKTRSSTKVGNDVGSKEKGLGIKRSGSGGVQSALGFSAKKSIHKSPTKKKKKAPDGIPQAIDLTIPSPPQLSSKSYAPVFAQSKRSALSKANPFLDEDEEEKPEVGKDRQGTSGDVVDRDEFGFVTTVPLDYSPLGLGKGKPTEQMIANLVGDQPEPAKTHKTTLTADREDSAKEEGGGTVEGDVDATFFLTERRTGKTGKETGGKVGVEEGGKLNVKDKRWNGIFKDTQEKMGGVDVEPIHCTPKTHNRVHHILRVFDLSSQWGPCVGITRLERWKRAEEWGLEPPVEVRDILLTQEGATDDSYRETVFHGSGIYVP